jgi:two-component system, cell cycle sensor histidine kinase and response regulator CckA
MKPTLRLLLVEDNDLDLELVLEEVEKGYSVTHVRAETAEELDAALDQGGFDIMITDYSLPALSAPVAIGLVRERGVDLPILVVSRTVGEEAAVFALRAGANDFMAKGRLARLRPAIERELREAEGRRQRRRAEDDLRASQARYRTIVENTSDGVWLLDGDARTVFANARLGHWLGLDPAGIVSRSIDEFVAAESRADVARLLAARGGAEQLEVRLRRADGSMFDALLQAAVFGDAGSEASALVTVVDITERKRLEAQLRQSHKMEAVGRLAGGVAHDFNNLLSVIMAYTSMLLDEPSLDSSARADLEEVGAAATRAAELTQQLLAFSRQQVLAPRVLDVNGVLTGVEKMVRRLLEATIQLTLLPRADVGMVRVDQSQLEQVLLNLIINARDAMPSGGRLTVSTTNRALDGVSAAEHHGVAPGRYVVVTVSDTGVGMDGATQARIFEPFFTTKEKGKGTGLGLATVFGIVAQSGGHVAVQSELGKGTTFHVYLPRVDSAAETVPPPSESVTLEGDETILVVEDDTHVRSVIEAVLSRAGYRVLAAGEGEEAIALVDRHAGDIDLLLIDVVMPGMSGQEVHRRLAATRRDIRVIQMSGYSENLVTQRDSLIAGGVFLQKPIDRNLLLRKVRAVLDDREPRRRRRAGR